MARPKRQATCHPDRAHSAKGLCRACLARSYNENARETITARTRVWRKATSERRRAYNIKAKYGLTLEIYHQMLDEQHGGCAICTLPLIPFGGPQTEDKAHVDHDHNTGEVRGILCMACNIMLGAAKDSTLRLAAAINYLNQGGRSE